MDNIKKKKNEGFSLVELLVSLGILTIVMTGTLLSIYTSNLLSIDSKEVTLAVNDVRTVLEQVKITPLASLPEDATVNAQTLWPNLNNIISNELAGEQIEVTGGAGGTLRQITVQVSWIGSQNRTKTISMVTQKSRFNG